MDKENILANFQSKAKNAAPIGGTIKFEIDGHSICIDGTGSENKILLEVLLNLSKRKTAKRHGLLAKTLLIMQDHILMNTKLWLRYLHC